MSKRYRYTAAPSRSDGTAQKERSLNKDEITLCLSVRGPTFSPRSRKRMICNQAPRLGRLTSRQADSLRRQVQGRKGPKPKPVPKITWRDLTDTQLAEWTGRIVRAASSNEEAKRVMLEELGYDQYIHLSYFGGRFRHGEVVGRNGNYVYIE